MQNIQSQGIYGFTDSNKDEYVLKETYELTDDDHYNIDELNELFFFLTPKMVHENEIDVTTICIVKVHMIGGVLLGKPLLCLLNTG